MKYKQYVLTVHTPDLYHNPALFVTFKLYLDYIELFLPIMQNRLRDAGSQLGLNDDSSIKLSTFIVESVPDVCLWLGLINVTQLGVYFSSVCELRALFVVSSHYVN